LVVETKVIELIIKFVEVDPGHGKAWATDSCTRTATHISRPTTALLNAKYSLCQDIYVGHHQVECTDATLLNVVQRVDMALVHIHKCIGRKFPGLVLTGTPLVDRSIQL
jgi:hypothetical protein